MPSHYMKHLPLNAKQIHNALTWVDDQGKVYGMETRFIQNQYMKKPVPHNHYGEFFEYSLIVNKRNGYVYAPVKYFMNEDKSDTENRQRRVHILVAENFIPNPYNLPIVGHKNNIKTDNRIENLYWTTPKENTQKAVDDGLLVNDKEYDDSQSLPVVMLDTYTSEVISRYGSVSIASEETGVPKSTILRQCRDKKPVRKPCYFRFQNDEAIYPPPIVIQYDYYTDEEIGRYWNTWDASRKTGIKDKTISQQCNNGWKPKTATKSRTYFLRQEQ